DDCVFRLFKAFHLGRARSNRNQPHHGFRENTVPHPSARHQRRSVRPPNHVMPYSVPSTLVRLAEGIAPSGEPMKECTRATVAAWAGIVAKREPLSPTWTRR